MPLLEIDQRAKIYYQDINPGGKESVLLLHGLGVTSASWQLQVPALLSAGYRILNPDIPGFGKSPYPGPPISVPKLASYMLALADSLNKQPIHVIGISMGGVIGLQYALDFPARTGKLVLINTFASLRPKSYHVWGYFILRFILIYTLGLKAQARYIAQRLFPQPDQHELRTQLVTQVSQADPRSYRAVMRSLARFNVTGQLDQVYSPTLIITGEMDATVSPENQLVLAHRIPNARHVVISDVGHAATVENPQACNNAILEFLGPASPMA